MIKIKDGKYLSIIILSIFLFLVNIDTNALILGSDYTNINQYSHTHISSNGNMFNFYRSNSGAIGGYFGTAYGSYAVAFDMTLKDISWYVGSTYSFKLYFSRNGDLIGDPSRFPIHFCFLNQGTNNPVICSTATTKRKDANNIYFDIVIPGPSNLNGTLLLNDAKIYVNFNIDLYPDGSYYVQNYTQPAITRTDGTFLTYSLNAKLSNFVPGTGTNPPDDPDDPDDPLDNSGSIIDLLQDNNSWLKKIHDKLDDFFDTSIDTSSFNNFFNNLSQKIPGNQIITGLITLPNTILTGLNNGLSNSCSPVVFGELYGTELSLPCFSPSDYLGTTIWGIIDLIFTCMLGWGWSKQLIKIYDSVTTLSKEGDIID